MSASNPRGAALTDSDPAAGIAENRLLIAVMRMIVLRKQSALTSLYRVMRLRVYWAAYRVLSSREDAEEIASDVFMYVWENAYRYCCERGSVSAWLTTITRNRAIDLVRKRRRDLSLDDDQPGRVAASEPSDLKDPYDLLARSQDVEALHAAIAALSPLRRKLVNLAFLQELTHENIIVLVALPRGTVKSHVRRALVSMRIPMARTPVFSRIEISQAGLRF
jgi:RNA polymerase sigma-70 factor (ECF subfamily)